MTTLPSAPPVIARWPQRCRPSSSSTASRRDPQDLRRPGRTRAGHARGAVLQRARAHRKRAGPGQDALRPHARAACSAASFGRIQFTRRPDALRHHRRPDLRHEDAGVPLPARAGLHAIAAGRRNQPLAGQDARRAAGDHAGVPRHGRAARATRSSGRSWCMATQNPIESEGTYNLPEAQLDRFMFKLVIDYPSAEEEAEHPGHAQRAGRSRPAAGAGCRRSRRPTEIVATTLRNGQVLRRSEAARLHQHARAADAAVAAVPPGRVAAGRPGADAGRAHAGRLPRPRLRRARRRGRTGPARAAAPRDPLGRSRSRGAFGRRSAARRDSLRWRFPGCDLPGRAAAVPGGHRRAACWRWRGCCGSIRGGR